MSVTSATAFVLVLLMGGAVTACTKGGETAGSPLRSAPPSKELQALSAATTWSGATPQHAPDLHGKVVLVQFWTYSCINWRRTLPHVRAWAEKYRDRGLVVVGVHTPEFAFEKDPANVLWAVQNMRIDYPVVLDSDFGIWSAFENQYWPALYFFDATGEQRHHVFGEGEYDESERVIQELLTEARRPPAARGLVAVTPGGAEIAPDLEDLRSAESYLGSGRADGFASPGGAAIDQPHQYVLPTTLRRDEWGLVGKWTVSIDHAALNDSSGRIAFRFHARDLHLVMGPPAPGTSVRFRVLIDGAPVGEAHGADVDDHGNGLVVEPRLYQLVRQPGAVVDREFEIEFLDTGVKAFVFTFG